MKTDMPNGGDVPERYKPRIAKGWLYRSPRFPSHFP